MRRDRRRGRQPSRCAAIGRAQPLLAVAVERGRRLVEQPDRRRRREQPGQRQPPPLPGRQPAARPIGDRVEPEGGERRVDRRGAATPRSAGPEAQHLARAERRLDRVEMADIVQPRAVAAGSSATGAPPQSSRPAAGGEQRRQAGAAGSICRCRWRRSAAARRPAASAATQARRKSAARRAGRQSPRRRRSPAVVRVAPRSREIAGMQKKSGSGGGIPEPRALGRGIGRMRGLGDKPVRTNLTHAYMRSELRLRFEQIAAI